MKFTDNEILRIFGQVLIRRDQPGFLRCYADAICCACSRDFLILRPASLILIAKYDLARLLPREPEIVVHNFPGRTA